MTLDVLAPDEDGYGWMDKWMYDTLYTQQQPHETGLVVSGYVGDGVVVVVVVVVVVRNGGCDDIVLLSPIYSLQQMCMSKIDVVWIPTTTKLCSAWGCCCCWWYWESIVLIDDTVWDVTCIHHDSLAFFMNI